MLKFINDNTYIYTKYSYNIRKNKEIKKYLDKDYLIIKS